MPLLEIIFQGVGGSLVLALIVWLLVQFAQKVVQRSIDIAAKRVESAVNRSEEAFKQLLKFNYDVDVDLRERRIAVYVELWGKTKLLPKWPRDRNVTCTALHELSEDLKNWYFDKGGMYLSRTTHNEAYSPLQEAITQVLQQYRKETLDLNADDQYREIPDDEYDVVYDGIRKKGSNLRTHLTNDILSRKTAPESA